MAIEGIKCPKTFVAEHTLVRLTVPRPLSGEILSGATTGKESRRNGDNIATIPQSDPSIDHGTIGTGNA